MSNGLFLYALPAFVVLMLVEWAGYRFDPDRRGGTIRDSTTSISIYLLGRVAKMFERFLVPFSILGAAVALTPWHLNPHEWWVWALGLVVTDFCYYWAHRADHRIRLLWAGHSVHHSSQQFNLTTAVRLPWLIPGTFIRSAAWIPAALIGLPLWMIFLLQSIGLLYQFPIHTQRIGKLPAPIEYIFNTPSHHRVHHGSNNPYLDKNYAGILIIWDRMFGSYAEELEPVRYGLTKNIDTHNPLEVNYHEFVRMISDVRHAHTWRARLGHIFAPPGWTPEPVATPHASELEPVGVGD
ncbi:sterol desaturase family protein [Nocardia sp. CA2R105]|uniref:sterol desaturase family protein n=1 Tax=Nocardia coffeae TaxID=2873381 RepID=UPI001CA6C43F|nr:sterol desaturase family protein [Nocardia coffeae]MBY8863021.1 sterol desaturase family protein [Nocardia coffeae]